jgi:hypothetical protein
MLSGLLGKDQIAVRLYGVVKLLGPEVLLLPFGSSIERPTIIDSAAFKAASLWSSYFNFSLAASSFYFFSASINYYFSSGLMCFFLASGSYLKKVSMLIIFLVKPH